jgi:hypothetical protein
MVRKVTIAYLGEANNLPSTTGKLLECRTFAFRAINIGLASLRYFA